MNNKKETPIVFDRQGDELWLAAAAYFRADPADTSEPLPEALTIASNETTERVYLHGHFLGIILETGEGGDFYAVDPQNPAEGTLYRIASRAKVSGLEWRRIYEDYLRRVIPGFGKPVELTADTVIDQDI